LGRLNAWQFAINLANNNITGGGFKCFTHRLFLVYAPDTHNFHVAHSIYFQVLGEHGYIGLGLFVLFIFLSWQQGNRIIKLCRQQPELDWAGNLAMACQASIIGYAVTGAFLSLAYDDLFYDIVALMILLEKVVSPAQKAIAARQQPEPVRNLNY
jgi:probable O-glycosylation ligase (exosortase A-associated)